MKYCKPIIKDLSMNKVAEGICGSGNIVTDCTNGGANATNQCSEGNGVFSINSSCTTLGNIADTCINGGTAGV